GLQGVTIDLNLTNAPFDQYEVRRAVALALDYDALANDVLDGVFDKATGVYPPKIVDGVIEPNTTDVEEAERLLDEAGWTQQGDGIRTKGGQELVIKVLRAAQDPETNSLGIA